MMARRGFDFPVFPHAVRHKLRPQQCRGLFRLRARMGLRPRDSAWRPSAVRADRGSLILARSRHLAAVVPRAHRGNSHSPAVGLSAPVSAGAIFWATRAGQSRLPLRPCRARRRRYLAALADVLGVRGEPLRRIRRADHEQGRCPRMAARRERGPAGHRKKTVGVTPSTVAKRCSVTAVGLRWPASRALTYER